MADKQKNRTPLYVLTLTLIMLVVGFIGALVIKLPTAASAKDSESETLISLIQSLEEENTTLEEDIAALLRESENYAPAEDFGGDQITSLVDSNNVGKANAGLTELNGAGIVVTLDDNPAAAKAAQDSKDPQYNAEDYIVHDVNLLYLVNDLRPHASGIAINGQRIVTSSTIRCVGTVILVNQTRLAPPYRIEVIGESQALMSALEHSGVYKELVDGHVHTEADVADSLTLPAYTGTIPQNYCTVVPEAPTPEDGVTE